MKIFAVNDERFESKYDTLYVELWYPRLNGHGQAITIGLSDVRAAADMQISYDFVRDGFVIRREHETAIGDLEWREVGFIDGSWDYGRGHD